ncbi:MAG TPA: MFS transporter [Acidimicrobiia bacterium]|nr:MFS transporter [Acidimicrobiia bacterium]
MGLRRKTERRYGANGWPPAAGRVEDRDTALIPVKRATTGVAVVFLANGVIVGSWIPRLPEIRDRLSMDLDTLGLTLALGGLGALIGSSVSGVVLGRIGARRSAVVGAGLLFLLLPLIAVVPTAFLLGLLLAVLGFVDAQADVGMNQVGVRVEESAGRSIMTRLHGLWSLGTLLGSGLSALAVLSGIRLGPQLAALSVAGLAVVALAARLVPDTAPRPGTGERSGRIALGLIVAGATLVVIEGTPMDWGAIFLIDVTGTTAAVGGTGVIVFTAGMLVGRMAGDYVVDRFRGVPTLFTGIMLSVAAMLLVVLSGSTAIALIGFGLWGLGISVALPVLYKLAGSHPSFAEGAGLAALTVGTRLGFMAAPALLGPVAAASSLSVALTLVVGLAAAAALVTIRLTVAGGGRVRDSLPSQGSS